MASTEKEAANSVIQAQMDALDGVLICEDCKKENKLSEQKHHYFE